MPDSKAMLCPVAWPCSMLHKEPPCLPKLSHSCTNTASTGKGVLACSFLGTSHHAGMGQGLSGTPGAEMQEAGGAG